MKIYPVGAKLFHADGWTNRHITMLTVAHSDFGTAPKKGSHSESLTRHYGNNHFIPTQNSSRCKKK